jgi:hypothetical protein
MYYCDEIEIFEVKYNQQEKRHASDPIMPKE